MQRSNIATPIQNTNKKAQSVLSLYKKKQTANRQNKWKKTQAMNAIFVRHIIVVTREMGDKEWTERSVYKQKRQTENKSDEKKCDDNNRQHRRQQQQQKQ